jgi:type IV secretion system protein VirB9
MMRLFLPFLLLGLPAQAQIYPQPGEGDPRIQTVQYDPLQIIGLSLAPGLQTMVELAPGEVIQTIGVGDSVAWQVSPGQRGDIFFIKNVGANSRTNMSVVTASRVYNFELAPSSGVGAISPYHVRILFPEKATGTVVINMEPIYEYRLSGFRPIRPSRVYQEGNRTILEWPEEAALPGIFTVENDNETLVNGAMQNGRFVIAGFPEKLVFRLDKKTAFATRKPIRSKSGE